MSRKFAEHTDVPVARSRAELEEVLALYGATSTAIFNSPNNAAIAFEMQGRRILIRLPLPDPKDHSFTHGRVNQSATIVPLPERTAKTRHEKACQRKWRALVLAVKAKLVSVEEGIETLEEAFLSHIVLPDGGTVGESVKPRLAQVYKENKMVPLLPYAGRPG